MVQRKLAPSSDRAPRQHLHAVLGALDLAGVKYALLRGYEHTKQNPGDREVDLLIDSTDLHQLTEIVGQEGLVPLPSWGHAPHRFFVGYDGDTDEWWKLDVVTDLRYGAPIRLLRGGNTGDYLGRRCADHRLTPEDELVALLFHCTLDKGRFEAKHRERLLILSREIENLHARAAEEARERLEGNLGPALSWPQTRQAIATGNWTALLEHRTALARQLFRREPVLTSWRWLSGRVLRLLRPLLIALRYRGPVVVLLGPDGAGKTTLGHALTQAKPLQARRIYLGTNVDSANVALPTTTWLDRQTTSRPDGGSGIISLLLKWLGFANRLAEQSYRYGLAHYHRLRGRLVVFDRYPYEPRPTRDAPTLRRCIRDRLLRVGAPKPHVIFILDAPAEVLKGRKDEHTLDRLRHMRKAYLDLQYQFPGAMVIDTTIGAGAVRRSVMSILWNVVAVDRRGRIRG